MTVASASGDGSVAASPLRHGLTAPSASPPANGYTLTVGVEAASGGGGGGGGRLCVVWVVAVALEAQRGEHELFDLSSIEQAVGCALLVEWRGLPPRVGTAAA